MLSCHGSYRNVSTKAFCVLVRILPEKLIVEELTSVYKLVREIHTCTRQQKKRGEREIRYFMLRKRKSKLAVATKSQWACVLIFNLDE